LINALRRNGWFHERGEVLFFCKEVKVGNKGSPLLLHIIS
jgi:hypothetical protein